MIRSILTLCLVALAANSMYASDGNKVLLIGIEGYEKATPLKYVGNDVRRLAESFSDRCGFEVQQVIDSAVAEDIQRIGPETHRDALMKTISVWVDGKNEFDTAILYFSGHGFVDKDGQLFLASINCDPRDPAPGGIPVAWLRSELARCPAKRKLLLLDACHAGTAKGGQDGRAIAKAVEVEMAKLTDVVTIASCTGDQNSFLWPGKRQSLFTYWLAEGTKGHADSDADRRVTIDELMQYLTRNVTRTANHLDHEQTPTLLGGQQASESLEFVPKAISLERLIIDMAEKINTHMRQQELAAVGIPEFASGEAGTSMAANHGSLNSYIANQLTDRLSMIANGDYLVINGPALHQELNRRGINAENVDSTEAKNLEVSEIKIPALVIGRIRGRDGATFRLGSKLQKPGSPSQVGSANGVCYLNESEWSMLGQSASQSDDIQGGSPETLVNRRVTMFDTESRGPHPVVDPNSLMQLEIWVKNSAGQFAKREGIVDGNDFFVTLEKGEIYQIRIVNRVEHGAFLRLLVDGLNTLPQKMNTENKGVTVEPISGEGVLTVAPRVNLTDAQAWYLKPNNKGSDGATSASRYSINGFYKQVGAKGAYNEFVVTDAPDSTAARKGYTQQIGLITAALYSPSSARGIGTTEGKEYKQNLKYYTGGQLPGDLMSVVHVHIGKDKVPQCREGYDNANLISDNSSSMTSSDHEIPK